MFLAPLLVPFLSFPLATPDDWPHLRGPSLDGRAAGALPAAREVALERVWSAAVGPAYSGIVVTGDRVVTMRSDGEVDAVVAFRASDGGELWRTVLGPIYLGHDGSEDGPVSSPVIGRGSVFAVDARGRLVSLSLEDGEVRWSVDLVADLGAVPPEYGFATTPLLEGSVLVVQAGGSEGRALCGFDADTGELAWSLGTGEAAYQSPVAMDLAGRRQVVVLHGREILGVAPDDGELLWTHALGERDEATTGFACALGPDGFFAFAGGTLVAFRVSADGDGYALEELYRSRELGRSYAAPVVHDGHLYGFKSDFLTCVDAATGVRVWKSRPPGGTGLIAVGDRLVVFGAEGVVTVARATPEAYREEARIQALAFTSFTWPSFAGGRLYVRNAEELACLALVARDAAAVAEAGETTSPEETAVAGTEFLGFVRAVEASGDKRATIEDYLAGKESFPILEGDLVHFVFQGDVEDVAIGGSMTGNARPEPMARIEGTDLHHRSYRIEPGARWEYRFQVDYERWIPDPRNPRTAPALWGEEPVSEVVTPGYEPAAHLREPDGPRGTLERLEYASGELGNTREIQVYLPAGYGEDGRAYPLLVVHQGPDWLERGLMATSLDNLVGESVRPLVVAFVAPLPQWWFEAGGSGTEEYLAMLAGELVPYLEARYRLSPRPEDRALMGVGGFGLTSAYGALLYPETFGKAAVQSVALEDVARHAFFERLARGAEPAPSFYVDWNRYEALHPDRGVDQRADGQRLFRALEERGYRVSGGEALDGHGWGSWRSRTDAVLEALFPLE